MKIAFDCRMLTKSGIGVYLENILEYLLDSSRYSFLLIGEKKHLSKYENRNNCEYLYTNTGIFTISELLFMNTKRINECTIFRWD